MPLAHLIKLALVIILRTVASRSGGGGETRHICCFCPSKCPRSVSLFLALTFSCPGTCINNVLSQDQAREAVTLSS